MAYFDDDGRKDFADYLIIWENTRRADHEKVATFDRALLRENGCIACDSPPAKKKSYDGVQSA